MWTCRYQHEHLHATVPDQRHVYGKKSVLAVCDSSDDPAEALWRHYISNFEGWQCTPRVDQILTTVRQDFQIVYLKSKSVRIDEDTHLAVLSLISTLTFLLDRLAKSPVPLSLLACWATKSKLLFNPSCYQISTHQLTYHDDRMDTCLAL